MAVNLPPSLKIPLERTKEIIAKTIDDFREALSFLLEWPDIDKHEAINKLEEVYNYLKEEGVLNESIGSHMKEIAEEIISKRHSIVSDYSLEYFQEIARIFNIEKKRHSFHKKYPNTGL